MGINIVDPAATKGFVTHEDLATLTLRLDELLLRLDFLDHTVDNLRDKSSPVAWDEILEKPISSLTEKGLIRIDSFDDSESVSTGASLWIVKNLLTQVRDLVLDSRKVNGKMLKTNITLTNVDVGTISKGDFDTLTSSVTLDGYVPKVRTINGKSLKDNITLTYEDIGGSEWKEYEGYLNTFFDEFVTWNMTINGTPIKELPTTAVVPQHIGYTLGPRTPPEADYTYNGLLFFPNTVTARIANNISIPAGSYQGANAIMMEAAIWEYDPEVVHPRVIRKDWTINGIRMDRDNGGINFKEEEIPGFCRLDNFTAAFDARLAVKSPVVNITFKDRKNVLIESIDSIPAGYVVSRATPKSGNFPANTVEIGIPYCVYADGTEKKMEMVS